MPTAPFVPSPEGKDQRIREIADPASPTKAAHGSQVQVSGAVVIAVDRFDETRNGRSMGTIYVADLGSKEPYSGISLYNPSFVPGNLRVGAGDALDLRGQFQENQNIPIQFARGAYLVQLSDAIGTFRFDARDPEPVEIDVADLSDYETGRKWLNMLVTVKNITVQGAPFGSGGRRSYNLLPRIPTEERSCEAPFPKVPTLTNELADLESLELKDGDVISSLTGVVTFFCNLHIAPRSIDDVVR